jgi:hypothetical protein
MIPGDELDFPDTLSLARLDLLRFWRRGSKLNFEWLSKFDLNWLDESGSVVFYILQWVSSLKLRDKYYLVFDLNQPEFSCLSVVQGREGSVRTYKSFAVKCITMIHPTCNFQKIGYTDCCHGQEIS